MFLAAKPRLAFFAIFIADAFDFTSGDDKPLARVATMFALGARDSLWP